MRPIEIEFLSKDEKKQRICQLYWLARDGKYVHTATDIAEWYGMTVQEIQRIVKHGCRVYDASYLCPDNKRPLQFFKSRIDRIVSLAGCFCAQCNAQQRANEAEAKKRLAAWHRKQKAQHMQRAFTHGTHRRLEPVARNFLIALAQLKNVEEAATSAGLSLREALPLVRELHNLHLVNIDSASLSDILPELKQELVRTTLKRGIDSVWFLPGAQLD